MRIGSMSRNLILRRCISHSPLPEPRVPPIFIPTIGLEVHAQVNSKSKLFSKAKTSFQAPPNSNVALFDASIPGTLPVLNKRVLEAAVSTALALHCQINYESSFDRKHYFYGDLPLGFQITQQEQPIGVDGYLDFSVFKEKIHDRPYTLRSRVKQIQMEQDSGKSFHDDINNMTLVDLNRAGIPLLEIVFDPDLKDGYEAVALIRDLAHLLKSVNSCECKMEEGTMRVDANISVRPADQEKLGIRTEVKNLNSMKAISKAIQFEIERQIKLLEMGKEVVNETMRFNSTTGQTEVMRDKEVVMDYRFLREGNLPLILLKDSFHNINCDLNVLDVHELRQNIPISPTEFRQEMMREFCLSEEDAITLQGMELEYEWFTEIMREKKGRNGSVVFVILTDILQEALSEAKQKIESASVSWKRVGEVSDLVEEGKISLLTAQDILLLLIKGEIATENLLNLVEERQWIKITDGREVTNFCSKAIEALPKRARDVTGKGKKYAFDVLVNLVIKLSERRIDRETIEKELLKLLKPPGGKVLSKKERLSS